MLNEAKLPFPGSLLYTCFTVHVYTVFHLGKHSWRNPQEKDQWDGQRTPGGGVFQQRWRRKDTNGTNLSYGTVFVSTLLKAMTLDK